MFLFPDNWSSMTGLLGANMVQNSGSLNSSANNVTKDEYDRLIAAGASFLPAAGAVIGSGFNYTDWPSIAGQYWVTTVIPNGVGEPSGDGWGFQIKNSSIDYPGGWSQGGGRPIRLVREVGL